MTTIFHISDLHFAEEYVYLDNNTSTTKNNNRIKGLEGHDSKIWLAFRNHLLNRIESCKNEYKICVTGDISRFGNIKSFELASELFFDESDSDTSKKYGLGLKRNKFIVVPGNHDSYDKSFVKKNNLRTFNGIFHPTTESYPIIIEETISNVDFTFINVDSTYKKNGASLAKKLGKGKVSRTQLDQIKGYFLNPKAERSVKILCMHHSPIILDKRHNRTLMLEKSQDLLKSVVNHNIDIVLCGHLHDDFYDILPLRKLIKLLPNKRGWGRIRKRIFQETQLNEYSQIDIKGKKARYLDSIAYHYIAQTNKSVLKENEFSSLKSFVKYLYGLPEHKEFLDDFNSFNGTETALIMSGSTCQENATSNSYIEFQITDDLNYITIQRHKFNKKTNKFESKETKMEYNKSV